MRLVNYTFNQLIDHQGADFNLVEPPAIDINEATFDDLLVTAKNERQDYKRSLLTVDVVSSDLESVEAKFHPYLEGMFDVFYVDDPAFDQDENNWRAMAVLTIPLYEGGLRFAEKEESTRSLKQAKLEVSRMEKLLRSDIEEAQISTQNILAEIESLKRQQVLAQKNYDIIISKFRHGATNSVDVNQAYKSLEKAQRGLITREFDHRVSTLKLKRAIGLLTRNIITSK